MSLYNLVPACAPCNSYLKGTLDFIENEHSSPFIDNEPDFYIENIQDIVINNTKSAIIRIDEKTKKQENSNTTFALVDRYEIFSEEIADIISTISTYKDQITRNIPVESHEIIFEIMLEGVNQRNYKNKIRGKLMLKLKEILIKTQHGRLG